MNSDVTSPTSQLIFQPFRRFTYVTAHSSTLPLLHLRHWHFTYVIGTSPTSQLILQPFRRFTYVTDTSRTSPSEPPHAYGDEKTVCGGLALEACKTQFFSRRAPDASIASLAAVECK